MPLSTWAWFITACIGLLAFADLLPACILLILDRTAGTSFFNPAGMVVSDTLLPHSGGSPLLWQHLFWFFGHPGGLHRDRPWLRNHFAYFASVYSQAAAWRNARNDRLHDRYRIPELHGLGPSHVPERNESVLGDFVFGTHADHHNSRYGCNADVAGLDLWREFALHERVALSASASSRCSSAAESADSSWRSRPSTLICTPPTSSLPTSIS